MAHNSLEDALGTAVEYSASLGHDNLGTLDHWNDFNGSDSIGYRFNHDTGAHYLVYGPESGPENYLLITAYSDMIAHIDNSVEDEALGQYLDADVAYRNEGEPDGKVAARAILDSTDRESMESVTEELSSILSSTESFYELPLTQNGSVRSFYVHKRFLPLHESLSATEYIEAIEHVVTLRNRAEERFWESVDIPAIEEEEDATEVGGTQKQPRAFR